jgi:hypothetical protein
MNTALLSLLAALVKFAAAFGRFFSEQKMLSAGQAQGRAESEREHALAAKRAEDEMRALAEKPASREEVLKRLDGGSA